MTQNVPLADGDPAVEGFFDAGQEMLSGAATNLEVDLLNATTVVVRAGTGDKQVSVSIGGQYRWITADKTRAHPGGAAGIYDLSVTSGNNAPGLGVPSNGDSSFDLAVSAAGVAPSGVARYRVVRRLTWDGTKITGVHRLPNEPHGEPPIGSLGATLTSGDPSPYWRILDGRSGSAGGMAVADYARLAVILGQTGQTWITLPDYRGYTLAGAINGGTPAGAGPNDNSRLQLVLGAAAGEVLHQLTIGNVPSHNHSGSTGGMSANASHNHGGSTGVADRSLDHLHLPPDGTDSYWPGTFGFENSNIGQGNTAVGRRTRTGGMDRSLDHLHGITAADLAHTHAVQAQGGGGSHENRQPTKAANIMVRVL